ncbi:MAG TPA: hypothetical protein GX707_01760 [Epulopiscium sp.]|nr:hypothetical protein [Candidatus Epulonipiscium sp.]
MTYYYEATFNYSKKCSFGGEVDIELIKEDGTYKNIDEIMKEVKQGLLDKYKQFFCVWQDISSIEVEDNNKNIIFKWSK